MSHLRIFDICREGTHVLGPGCRYVIWTQGCDKQCPGCITPESRSPEDGYIVESDDLAADIILSEKIDGITISGGEPFLQAEALTRLLELVKSHRPELTVIVYSGYTFGQLKEREDCRQLLEYTDVLIDGPYIQELDDGKGIRGSGNQRIISLTGRLDPFIKTMCDGERKVQYLLDKNGTVTLIGVPHNS